MKALVIGAAALLATVAATGTGNASTGDNWAVGTGPQEAVIMYGYYNGVQVNHARTYGAHGAIEVCDDSGDGYGASVEYMRVNTSGPATVWEEDGVNHCASSSNIESNPIEWFRVCRDIPGPDICNPNWIHILWQ